MIKFVGCFEEAQKSDYFCEGLDSCSQNLKSKFSPASHHDL